MSTQRSYFHRKSNPYIVYLLSSYKLSFFDDKNIFLNQERNSFIFVKYPVLFVVLNPLTITNFSNVEVDQNLITLLLELEHDLNFLYSDFDPSQLSYISKNKQKNIWSNMFDIHISRILFSAVPCRTVPSLHLFPQKLLMNLIGKESDFYPI